MIDFALYLATIPGWLWLAGGIAWLAVILILSMALGAWLRSIRERDDRRWAAQMADRLDLDLADLRRYLERLAFADQERVRPDQVDQDERGAWFVRRGAGILPASDDEDCELAPQGDPRRCVSYQMGGCPKGNPE